MYRSQPVHDVRDKTQTLFLARAWYKAGTQKMAARGWMDAGPGEKMCRRV